MPGIVRLSANLVITTEFSNNLNAYSNMKVLLPYGGTIDVSCTGHDEHGCGGVGSCTYCDLLNDCQLRTPAGYPMACSTLIGIGTYHASLQRTISQLPTSTKWFWKNGDIVTMEIQLKIKDMDKNDTVACGVVYLIARVYT
uniref:Uncharacterized protein n=1 Tax=Romanomermis culicivorax TaxID=13658 RepID=A0A915KD59_ROMCU